MRIPFAFFLVSVLGVQGAGITIKNTGPTPHQYTLYHSTTSASGPWTFWQQTGNLSNGSTWNTSLAFMGTRWYTTEAFGHSGVYSESTQQGEGGTYMFTWHNSTNVGPASPFTNYVSNKCWTNNLGQAGTATPIVWLADGTWYALPSANLANGGHVCWNQTNTQAFDVVVNFWGDLLAENPFNGPAYTNSATGIGGSTSISGSSPTTAGGTQQPGQYAGQLGATNEAGQIQGQQQAIGNATVGILRDIRDNLEGLGGGGTNVSDAGTHERLDGLATNIANAVAAKSDTNVGGQVTNWSGAYSAANSAGALDGAFTISNVFAGFTGPGSIEQSIGENALKWTFSVSPSGDPEEDTFTVNFNPASREDTGGLFSGLRTLFEWILAAWYAVLLGKTLVRWAPHIHAGISAGSVPNLQVFGSNVLGKIAFAVIPIVLLGAMGAFLGIMATEISTGVPGGLAAILNESPLAGFPATVVGLVSLIFPLDFALGLFFAWLSFLGLVFFGSWVLGCVVRFLPG